MKKPIIPLHNPHIETIAPEDSMYTNFNVFFRSLSEKIAHKDFCLILLVRHLPFLSLLMSMMKIFATFESGLLDYFKLATQENAVCFPYLEKFALGLLAIMAYSASAHQFLAAVWNTLGRKNRTTQDILAAKVVLTCNMHLSRPMLL